MSKNFARKTFDKWLGIHQKRFKFSPWIDKSRKDYFVLRFYGVTDRIACYVRNGGQIEMIVHDDKDQYWDILADFDILERRSDDGMYYCELCEDRKIYLTRESLWEKHGFESILAWINALTPDKYIFLWGDQEACWGAALTNFQDENYSFFKNKPVTKIPCLIHDQEYRR